MIIVCHLFSYSATSYCRFMCQSVFYESEIISTLKIQSLSPQLIKKITYYIINISREVLVDKRVCVRCTQLIWFVQQVILGFRSKGQIY